MTDPTIDNATKATAASLSDARDNAKIVLDKNAAAFSETGHSVLAVFQELTQAYQQIATKNSAKLTESIQALGSVKNPVDFVGLQQKLVKEGFESALADSRHIAELTMSIFTTAFDPMKKNMASLQQAMPQSVRPAR